MTRPDDDEITTDVDPAWVAEIADRHAESQPDWDPEATIGASDDLIERIRQEVAGHSDRIAVATPQPPATPPSDPPPDPSPDPLPDPSPHPAAPLPPPPVADALKWRDDTASTTMRWEPRQRLPSSTPFADAPTITIAPPHGIDRTKLAIAVIVAVALVAVVWLLVRGGGDDPPVPPVTTEITDVVGELDDSVTEDG